MLMPEKKFYVYRTETAKNITSSDIVYSLPYTVVEIVVDMQQLKKVPGPYAEYTNRYLGEIQTIRQNKVVHVPINIRLKTYPVSDSNMLFVVKARNTKLRKNLYKLDTKGLIQILNNVEVNRHTDMVKGVCCQSEERYFF